MSFFGGGGGAAAYPPTTSSTGAVQVGFSGGDALGTDAINIQPNRSATNQVASNLESIVIGKDTRAYDAGALGAQIVIGKSSIARYRNGVAIGNGASSLEGNVSIGLDAGKNGNQSYCIAIGQSTANTVGIESVAIGSGAATAETNAAAFGKGVTANLRGQFITRPFSSVYWSGTTTNATPSVLSLDGTATNRFTIAANTAAMVDINIIARRTDTVDKWFSSRRMVAIRRNNANGTAIIGSVQTIGTDQTEGSPTWSVAITADDTNEALQVEVTGATSETVSWRVMAFYQVV